MLPSMYTCWGHDTKISFIMVHTILATIGDVLTLERYIKPACDSPCHQTFFHLVSLKLTYSWNNLTFSELFPVHPLVFFSLDTAVVSIAYHFFSRPFKVNLTWQKRF